MQQVEEEFRQGNYSLVVEVVSSELAEDNAGFQFSDDSQRTSHCLMLVHSLKALANDKVRNHSVLLWRKVKTNAVKFIEQLL